MTISKPYLTFLISLMLAAIGSVIAYLTNWRIVIPVFFGLGIPLINIDKSLKQKISLTVIIVCVSIVIFSATAFASISFKFDKYIFPSLLVGFAGIAILAINGLLIESVKIKLKTIVLTFLLSSLSLPIWILVTEKLFYNLFKNIIFFRQYGVMLFWMILTTIGICLSIKLDNGSEEN